MGVRDEFRAMDDQLEGRPGPQPTPDLARLAGEMLDDIDRWRTTNIRNSTLSEYLIAAGWRKP